MKSIAPNIHAFIEEVENAKSDKWGKQPSPGISQKISIEKWKEFSTLMEKHTRHQDISLEEQIAQAQRSGMVINLAGSSTQKAPSPTEKP